MGALSIWGGRAPVVVCGPAAKDPQVASALARGIDPRDAQREPTGAARTLLLNAIPWLGRQ